MEGNRCGLLADLFFVHGTNSLAIICRQSESTNGDISNETDYALYQPASTAYTTVLELSVWYEQVTNA